MADNQFLPEDIEEEKERARKSSRRGEDCDRGGVGEDKLHSTTQWRKTMEMKWGVRIGGRGVEAQEIDEDCGVGTAEW